MAHCPVHLDQKPSLNIVPSRDGRRVLVKCFAGCALPQILEAVGLTEGDLDGGLVGVYDYCDSAGKLLYQACRFAPKDFKVRRPDGNGGHVWKLTGVQKVLYKLPELLSRPSGEPVFVVEGEKDADNLAALDLVATTTLGGAKARWLPTYAESLRGAHVVILPDNDAPGRGYAAGAARALWAVAESVRIVELPGLPAKGDVSDWLAAKGTREDLLELVQKAPLWQPDADEPTQPTLASTGTTDTANGGRFVQAHGHVAGYIFKHRRWLIWDGQRWAPDEAELERRAKQTARGILAEAMECTDLEKQDKLIRWAQQSQMRQRLEAMIWAARSEVAVSPEELDQHPWLVNCQNGTLDLRTGNLRAHSRDDRLTKVLPVAYEESAVCPLWDQFLLRILDNDPDMVSFLQRAVGYALTGETAEQCLFLLHGQGNNGKSTFLEVLIALFGDYARPTDFRTLLQRDRAEGPRNDLAALAGLRLVTAIEPNRKRVLDEALVKQLTGSDTITARFLYGEFFDFMPRFKLFLAANHKPTIQGTDDGIWRRIRLVPFDVRISREERDKHLPEKLKHELPGILAWAVRGCQAWQKEGGLKEPGKVREATREYRNDSDVLREFLRTYCVEKPKATVTAGALHKEYQQWCEENGVEPLARNLFGEAMGERGFRAKTERGGASKLPVRVYAGIGLRGKSAARPRADPEDLAFAPCADDDDLILTMLLNRK